MTKKPKNQNQQNNQKPDSSTQVNSGMEKLHTQVNHSKTIKSDVVGFRLDGRRVTVGFKCNKKLWDCFVSFAEREFGSVCHILEPIILALLTAQVRQSKTVKPIVIENLVVERAVKRVRRYGVQDMPSVSVDGEVEVDVDGKRVVPFYELDERHGVFGVWRWVKVENDWDVNVNGHYVGCRCSVCSRSKASKHE